jgi:hypothetical protein
MGQSLNGFQIHHIISQDVATYNPLIKALTATGYFNLNEDSNLIGSYGDSAPIDFAVRRCA